MKMEIKSITVKDRDVRDKEVVKLQIEECILQIKVTAMVIQQLKTNIDSLPLR